MQNDNRAARKMGCPILSIQFGKVDNFQNSNVNFVVSFLMSKGLLFILNFILAQLLFSRK